MIKDLFALAVILAVFFAVVGFMPNYLAHPDNYVTANPLATPPHIVPEWYFLPFYAILRAFTRTSGWCSWCNWISFGIIDAKFFGVLAMFGAIAVMALAPWLDTSSVRSGRFRPTFKWWFSLLAIDFVVLMWAGAQPAEFPYDWISLIAADLLVRLLPDHPAAAGCHGKAAAAACHHRRRLQIALRSDRRHHDRRQPGRVRKDHVTMLRTLTLTALTAAGAVAPASPTPRQKSRSTISTSRSRVLSAATTPCSCSAA